MCQAAASAGAGRIRNIIKHLVAGVLATAVRIAARRDQPQRATRNGDTRAAVRRRKHATHGNISRPMPDHQVDAVTGFVCTGQAKAQESRRRLQPVGCVAISLWCDPGARNRQKLPVRAPAGHDQPFDLPADGLHRPVITTELDGRLHRNDKASSGHGETPLAWNEPGTVRGRSTR